MLPNNRLAHPALENHGFGTEIVEMFSYFQKKVALIRKYRLNLLQLSCKPCKSLIFFHFVILIKVFTIFFLISSRNPKLINNLYQLVQVLWSCEYCIIFYFSTTDIVCSITRQEQSVPQTENKSCEIHVHINQIIPKSAKK